MRKVIIVFLVLITLLFLFLYLHPADKRNHSEKDPIDELIKNMTVEEKNRTNAYACNRRYKSDSPVREND